MSGARQRAKPAIGSASVRITRPPSPVSTFALHLRHHALSYFALLVALGSADVYRRFDLDARPVD
jgi:hypothetical protein